MDNSLFVATGSFTFAWTLIAVNADVSLRVDVVESDADCHSPRRGLMLKGELERGQRWTSGCVSVNEDLELQTEKLFNFVL